MGYVTTNVTSFLPSSHLLSCPCQAPFHHPGKYTLITCTILLLFSKRRSRRRDVDQSIVVCCATHKKCTPQHFFFILYCPAKEVTDAMVDKQQQLKKKYKKYEPMPMPLVLCCASPCRGLMAHFIMHFLPRHSCSTPGSWVEQQQQPQYRTRSSGSASGFKKWDKRTIKVDVA